MIYLVGLDRRFSGRNHVVVGGVLAPLPTVDPRRVDGGLNALTHLRGSGEFGLILLLLVVEGFLNLEGTFLFFPLSGFAISPAGGRESGSGLRRFWAWSVGFPDATTLW